MVCRHPDVGRPFLEHSQDRAEHAVDGAKRMVGQLRAAKPVEMAKELVCTVDEVDDHAAISCSIRRTRSARPCRADGNPGIAIGCARRALRRTSAASGSEPRAVGPSADSARPRGAPSSRDARGTSGPYVLQAAIAACHARARAAHQTDWARIAALYAA